MALWLYILFNYHKHKSGMEEGDVVVQTVVSFGLSLVTVRDLKCREIATKTQSGKFYLLAVILDIYT